MFTLPVSRTFTLFAFAFVWLTATIGGVASASESREGNAAKPNRLIHEKSPYLRQHAFNPVDWYPWGPEAFEKARKENKPIFLSIGYSTCHWCHVMELESFSNPEVARLLNENFVAIKVDREERPDIDRVYMTFVQASTGSGGWPLSVWLTPELKPFFGGTYFPPESHPDQPGFKTLLIRIAGMWSKNRNSILQQSTQMLDALAADTKATASTDALPINDLRLQGYKHIAETFDGKNGGFESAPKFPNAVIVGFLFDIAATSKDAARRDEAQQMALKTLREIAAGGIHDHLGGGFHRYSVDAIWHVPHFEKMLYDQAQLASVYLTAWQVSSDPVFQESARDTLRYVRQQMTDPEGGFYSAEDADSVLAADPAKHSEGAFYLWTKKEIETILGPKQAPVFAFAYGVQADGNVAAETAGEFAQQNILFRAHSLAECAKEFGLSEMDTRLSLAASLPRLREARSKRPRPARDDKVVTAWNGLMISAFARGAQILEDPELASAAGHAAKFLQAKLFDSATGRLARSFRAGVRDEQGFAEDYAFLVQGLIDLYETTFETRWLEWAIQLQEKQNELFLDSANGGYFANRADDPSVLLRLKEDNDGAEPSANSVSVRNLARLAEILHREEWRDLALRTARAFHSQLDRVPGGMPEMLSALGWLEGSPKQVLIQGDPSSPKTHRLINEVWKRFVPHRVLVRIDPQSRPFFESKVPFIAGLPPETGASATAYVCENFACQLPTSDPQTLVKLLTGKAVGSP